MGDLKLKKIVPLKSGTPLMIFDTSDFKNVTNIKAHELDTRPNEYKVTVVLDTGSKIEGYGAERVTKEVIKYLLSKYEQFKIAPEWLQLSRKSKGRYYG